ncbi:hypothetical protein [Helicobacter bilis]|uniref:hypothetical protein n=1 Tax=Helicobacter bilis TaxID=37372 RepID=UPI0018832EB7|nr:hypothetical protein [Helicobacter bilis]
MVNIILALVCNVLVPVLKVNIPVFVCDFLANIQTGIPPPPRINTKATEFLGIKTNE